MADLPQTNAPLPAQAVNPLLDQLLKDLKIDTLPKVKQGELLGQIKELAERRILQVMIANLDESKLAELRQKMEAGAPPEEVGAWVAAQPGLREKVEQEMRVLYESLTQPPPASGASPTPAVPQPPKSPVIIPVEQQPATPPPSPASGASPAPPAA